jgi:FkbM family methyltransferase
VIVKIVKSLIRRIKCATVVLPNYPKGTKFPLFYRFRRLFIPNTYFPAYLKTPQKIYHYLSSDPLDERVLEEILGSLNNLFFPEISGKVKNALLNGGYVLDVGAFNGGWGVEMLANYPNSNAIFFEPNPEKCININKTLMKSNLISRSKIIDAGIAKKSGNAWLIKSKDGAWGDWLEYSQPKTDSIKVKTVTLSDSLNKKIEPVIVKCNAEGGEFEFVNQLIQHKIKPQIMVLMVHTEMGDVDLLYNNLSNFGYSIKKVKEHLRRPVWHVILDESSYG